MHCVADSRRLLPSVVFILQEMIEEPTQVLSVRFVVIVRPFLAVVDSQPLLLGDYSVPRAECPRSVQGVRVSEMKGCIALIIKPFISDPCRKVFQIITQHVKAWCRQRLA